MVVLEMIEKDDGKLQNRVSILHSFIIDEFQI